MIASPVACSLPSAAVVGAGRGWGAVLLEVGDFTNAPLRIIEGRPTIRPAWASDPVIDAHRECAVVVLCDRECVAQVGVCLRVHRSVLLGRCGVAFI